MVVVRIITLNCDLTSNIIVACIPFVPRHFIVTQLYIDHAIQLSPRIFE